MLVILLNVALIGCNNQNVIAKVHYNYSGCFGGYKCELILYKENDTVIANWKMEGTKDLKKKLTSSRVDSFNLFMRELKDLKEEYGCTTTEKYVVETKEGIIRKVDGGCDWNGFDKLTTALFRP